MNKDEIRQQIWAELEKKGEAAFPFPPTGRIPNFIGSSRAADRVTELEAWSNASVIKANPDAPQRYIRKLAMEQGKVVYMAVPRLKDRDCFVKLDVPKSHAKKAASISGAFEIGRQVHPEDIDHIDLVVTGCVAVNQEGQRIGKGEGYSDLELAILSQFGKINTNVPIITTVHPIQIIKSTFPQQNHDIILQYILTEDDIIITGKNTILPQLNWDRLSTDKIAEIPILSELQ